MSRILQHILDEKGGNCKICGTSVAQMKAGYTCVWRDVPDDRDRVIRPEPKEREYGIYDSETIFSRLNELKVEKDGMINHVDED